MGAKAGRAWCSAGVIQPGLSGQLPGSASLCVFGKRPHKTTLLSVTKTLQSIAQKLADENRLTNAALNRVIFETSQADLCAWLRDTAAGSLLREGPGTGGAGALSARVPGAYAATATKVRYLVSNSALQVPTGQQTR